MTKALIHKEDVKAALRKRYRSLAAFERAQCLPAESVADVLRGRSVKRTAQAIADALGVEIQGCTPAASVNPDNSPLHSTVHFLNEGVR